MRSKFLQIAMLLIAVEVVFPVRVGYACSTVMMGLPVELSESITD